MKDGTRMRFFAVLLGCACCCAVQIVAHAAPPVFVDPAAPLSIPTSDLSTWLAPLGQFGIASLIVYWVFQRDVAREARMAAALDAQQQFINEKMYTQNERMATAIERLCDRPCMVDDGK